MDNDENGREPTAGEMVERVSRALTERDDKIAALLEANDAATSALQAWTERALGAEARAERLAEYVRLDIEHINHRWNGDHAAVKACALKLRDLMVAIEAHRDLTSQADCSCWMIERGQHQGEQSTLWWTGSDWSRNPLKGLRFASKQAATDHATASVLLTGIDGVHPRKWEVTEHVFVDAHRDLGGKESADG